MVNPLDKKIYLWSSFKDKILPEHTGKGKVLKLSKYTLPKVMYDTELQKEVCNTPISVNDFITTISALIKKQSKGESGVLLNNGYANIFHTQTKDGVVAVGVDWNDGEWDVGARGLDYDYRWDGGDSFFSPLTAGTKTLKSDPLTLEPFETLVTICPHCRHKLKVTLK